jgi:superfamily II DNA or RNA helicase
MSLFDRIREQEGWKRIQQITLNAYLTMPAPPQLEVPVETVPFSKLRLPFELRPYQKEGLEKFLEAKKGLEILPTGTGKSAVVIEAIRRLQLRTAIFCPTIVILKQWVRWIRKFGYPFVGEFYGDKKRLSDITVFTYQSATRHSDILSGFPFLAFDEAHHLVAPIWSSLLEYAKNAQYALGMTSSFPRRHENADSVLKVMPLIYKRTFYDLMRLGYVAPTEVIPEPVTLTYDEMDRYNRYQEIIAKATRALGTPDPTVWNRECAMGNSIACAGLRAFSDQKTLLSNIEAKKPKILEIVKRHPNEMILIFSERIDSIEALKDYLTKNGINCRTFHSRQSEREQMKILEEWGETFNILCSVSQLEEGRDIPELSVEIFSASGVSSRKIIQRIGRAVRPVEGKVAKIYVIYGAGTKEVEVLRRVKMAVSQIEMSSGLE